MDKHAWQNPSKPLKKDVIQVEISIHAIATELGSQKCFHGLTSC